MQKDFDIWNNKKKSLEGKETDFLFRTGEVWWSSVGINIGEESCGKGETFRRPILVVRKLSRQNFIGVPLSTQPKIGSWFTTVNIQGKKQAVLLYQIKMFSTRRFQRRLTTLDEADFKQVKEKLEQLLELSVDNHQNRSPGSVGYPKSKVTIA
ncbi:TPA: toxin-antitoxin system protein [Candidatus Uhrbacteria bacterium]|nr:toxin-antitoxin system protein [Candidatus Uhrbacteria bacterium]